MTAKNADDLAEVGQSNFFLSTHKRLPKMAPFSVKSYVRKSFRGARRTDERTHSLVA